MSGGPIIGVDLGTAYATAAWVDESGRARVLSRIPSVVAFVDGSSVVGARALAERPRSPTVRHLHRAMGEPGAETVIDGATWTPPELSALILRELKTEAERALGTPIRDAVLTVPTRWDGARRGGAAEAGSIAGFEVLSVVNESTAAARSVLDPRDARPGVLVVDLGAGSFKVAVLDPADGRFATRAQGAWEELGGLAWDLHLVAFVAGQCLDAVGVDPRAGSALATEQRCRAARIALCAAGRVAIGMDVDGRRVEVGVEPGLFSALADGCKAATDGVLQSAGVSWEDLGHVLLVGGVRRVPLLGEWLAKRAGAAWHQGADPDGCVAMGAAMHGVATHR